MALFVSEAPVLGPNTTVQEISGYTISSGAAPVTLAAYKPGTRELINVPMSAVLNTAANLAGWAFEAPWACKVVAIRFNATTHGSAGVLSVVKIMADSVAPAAANGTTILALTASTLTFTSGTADNTRTEIALSATAANLLLAAGDQIAWFLTTAPTALVGGNLQIELVQIG